MSQRALVVKTIRSFAGRMRLPVGDCFTALYDAINQQHNVNLYALSKMWKCSKMDAVEKRGLMNAAFEIAQNLNYQPELPPHPVQQEIFGVDPKTGEILE